MQEQNLGLLWIFTNTSDQRAGKLGTRHFQMRGPRACSVPGVCAVQILRAPLPASTNRAHREVTGKPASFWLSHSRGNLWIHKASHLKPWANTAPTQWEVLGQLVLRFISTLLIGPSREIKIKETIDTHLKWAMWQGPKCCG